MVYLGSQPLISVPRSAVLTASASQHPPRAPLFFAAQGLFGSGQRTEAKIVFFSVLRRQWLMSEFHFSFLRSAISFFDHCAYCKHVKKSNHKDDGLSARAETGGKFPVPARRQAGSEPDLLSVCLPACLSIYPSLLVVKDVYLKVSLQPFPSDSKFIWNTGTVIGCVDALIDFLLHFPHRDCKPPAVLTPRLLHQFL